MIIRHFPLAVEQANLYIVVDEATRDGVLVDAGEFSAEAVDFIRSNGVKLRAIFITHSHYDHNGAVGEYVKAFAPDAVYGGSPGCAGPRTRVVHDGDDVVAGSLRARALSVTGHTSDQVMLYFPDAKAVFTGDALFAGSVGGTAGEERRAEQIDLIRKKLLTLPEDVRVYSGHGPATTIHIEKHHNPFLASR